MDSRPVPAKRRRVLEGLIRLVDMAVYGSVTVGGIFALTFPPRQVTLELAGWEWLIPMWGVILLLGGIGGLIGRLTRYWVIEVPALPLSGIGIGIYFVILGASSFQSAYSAVATMLILAALLNMIRRYLELQLFASEPGDRPLRERVYAVTHRRTANTVRREG